jgi:hypothetical protein
LLSGSAGDDPARQIAAIRTGQVVSLDTSVDQGSSWGLG